MEDMLKNNGEVIPIMSKEMNWDNFVPTKEIREYDMKLRESIRQREQLKLELAEQEKKPRDIFWDVEYAMFSAGLKYFNTCSEYWLYKVESDKNRIDDVIRGLNETCDSIKNQLDSWCIIYSEETGKAGNFKNAYIKCVDEYEKDVKEVTDRLEEILNDNERDIREQKKDWTMWIIAFREKLKEHQEAHRQTMLKAVHDWLKEEQKELDELRNQLIAFYPRIKSKNN